MLEPGQYKHYKGQLYEVIAMGRDSETKEDVVIYRPLYKSEIKYWVRPLKMFMESVEIDGKKLPRFEKVIKPFAIEERKNYLAFIDRLPGSTMWQHLYGIDHTGVEHDLTDTGDKSCAYMVSSVLLIFGLIGSVHATVSSTIRDLELSDWEKVDQPQAGDVVLWSEHVGFYLADDEAISTSSHTTKVGRHSLTLSDGREPLAFYRH